MSDLIERKTLKKMFEESCIGECDCCSHKKDNSCGLIENAPSVRAKDLSMCKPVKIRYRGNSKTISGYLDETRNIVFTQAVTVELLGSAGFSVEIEEEQLRDGGSEK